MEQVNSVCKSTLPPCHRHNFPFLYKQYPPFRLAHFLNLCPYPLGKRIYFPHVKPCIQKTIPVLKRRLFYSTHTCPCHFANVRLSKGNRFGSDCLFHLRADCPTHFRRFCSAVSHALLSRRTNNVTCYFAVHPQTLKGLKRFLNQSIFP